jgi:hypothetical protein
MSPSFDQRAQVARPSAERERSMLNLTLIGNLGSDPVLGATQKGSPIATLRRFAYVRWAAWSITRNG